MWCFRNQGKLSISNCQGGQICQMQVRAQLRQVLVLLIDFSNQEDAGDLTKRLQGVCAWKGGVEVEMSAATFSKNSASKKMKKKECGCRKG